MNLQAKFFSDMLQRPCFRDVQSKVASSTRCSKNAD
jgi:hypothetical protein